MDFLIQVISVALALAALAGVSSASADDATNSLLSNVELHGFLSQGFIKTTDNNYLGYSKLGTFDFTESGINLTKQLTDNLRTGVQLATERVGQLGNFNVQLDWFYVDYHPSDQFGARFGRIKLPFGLYNDVRDIDAARAPILLPQSIYPEQSQLYLLAEDGFEFYGYNPMGAAGALDYRFYTGTIFIDTSSSPAVQSFNVPYLAGGRVMWETPLEGLRAGMSLQILRLDLTGEVGSTTVTGEIPALLWVTSAEYTRNKLLLAAEFNRDFITTGDSNNPSIFPAGSVVSNAGYVMSAYHVNRWLQPALYYSILFSNAGNTGLANEQHDISATLRFDINPYWLVKVEGHFMRGTAGLTSALNNAEPLSSLNPTWGVFLLKTTAYF